MCYTSGTTGNPKGVVYSHRSNVLHAMAARASDVFGIASRDVVLPIVPLFHANSWSLAFSAPMSGASLVMPGPKLDGASVYELLDTCKVTIAAAVPTIWMMLLQHLEANNLTLPNLKRVLIGGSACPRMMLEKFQDNYGVPVTHAWGMTEMSPIGTCGSMKPEVEAMDREARIADHCAVPPPRQQDRLRRAMHDARNSLCGRRLKQDFRANAIDAIKVFFIAPPEMRDGGKMIECIRHPRVRAREHPDQ